MRYVFLDIDGPLNNHPTSLVMHDIEDVDYVSPDAIWEGRGGIVYLMCPWMVNNLYDVMRAYDDVKLIGISSWFRGGSVDCEGVRVFERLTGLKINDVIEYTGGGEYRFTCSEQYATVRGVEKYVIIDDLQFEHEKLVKIYREGLTHEKALEAIRMIE